MYTEMDALIELLDESTIPYETSSNRFSNKQLWYPSKARAKYDVVCNKFSYGGKEGLLELMIVNPYEDKICLTADEIKGYLIAEEAFEIIAEDFFK